MASDAKSDYLETAVLNHFLRHGSITSPTAVYLALFTADPTDANGGTEVSGGTYARQAITFGAPTTGGTTSVTNSSAVSFTGMPTATVTHWAIYDASTGGNELYHSPFDVAKSATAGDTLTVPISGITITEQ